MEFSKTHTPVMGPPAGDLRVFAKEATVVLDVGDNRKVPGLDVISAVEEKYGKGSLFACVPRSGNCFEVTLATSSIAEKMSTGLKMKGYIYPATLLYSDIVVVSFMHLPAYILDREIENNLRDLRCEVRSPVYRRYYPGTHVADGTRYVNIKFPSGVKSLNYLMKFNTVHGIQMFKVKHDNMTKVCSNCLSSDHLFATCPNFKCYQCGLQGHVKKRCTTEVCRKCHYYPKGCECDAREREMGDDNVVEVEVEVEKNVDDDSAKNVDDVNDAENDKIEDAENNIDSENLDELLRFQENDEFVVDNGNDDMSNKDNPDSKNVATVESPVVCNTGEPPMHNVQTESQDAPGAMIVDNSDNECNGEAYARCRDVSRHKRKNPDKTISDTKRVKDATKATKKGNKGGKK